MTLQLWEGVFQHLDHLMLFPTFWNYSTFLKLFNVCTEHPWRKLNSAPVCFGAKDSQFGQFQVEFGGSVRAVKLFHLYGLVTCGKGWTKWGCLGKGKLLNVLVTNASNSVLLPMGNAHKNYQLLGYHSNSTEVVFSDFPGPLQLSSGQELLLWFTTDYNNYHESDNGGTTCADVFAKYL